MAQVKLETGKDYTYTPTFNPMLPTSQAPAGDQPIDPSIIEMCSHFKIEDRVARRLHNAMRKRTDSFDEDIAALWEILGEARHAAGMLQSKILEIENDDFHINGKIRAKVNKDVQ